MNVGPGGPPTRCDSAGVCRRSYFQAFKLPAEFLAAARIDTAALGHNVMAVVPGIDSALAHEWIVVGAHFDHLGQTGYGVRDPRNASAPHLGADDNASGTAAVLEIARRLSASPARRSVLFVHFGAEELGLIGSSVFMLAPPIPIGAMVAMVNLDMVGRLERGRLQLFGLESSRQWGRVIDGANAGEPIPLARNPSPLPDGAASDHIPFFRAGVPVVHLFTGLHGQYHTKDDTADRIDFDGLVRIVEFTERLVRLLGDGTALPKRAAR